MKTSSARNVLNSLGEKMKNASTQVVGWRSHPKRKSSASSLRAGTSSSQEAVLVAPEGSWRDLREHLLRPDGLERVAFLLLGVRESEDGTEYLLHRVKPVADSDCSQQSPVIIEPNPVTVLDNFGSYTESAASAFAHVHSHPFSGRPEFSAGDDRFLSGHLNSFFGYLDSAESDRPRRFLRMVLGTAEDGFYGEVYDEKQTRIHRIREIRLIGNSGERFLKATVQKVEEPCEQAETLEPAEHLDRNIRWLGKDGQKRISEQRIAICGLGGIGMEILKHCRGLGFRKFILVDPDRLEASNLNRLFWSPSDVGKTKVELAEEFVHALDPEADVTTFFSKVEEPECEMALLGADIIVGATDSDSARLSIQLLAARHLKSIVDLGAGIHLDKARQSVIAMGGQVSCYIPGGPCLCCQGLNPGVIMDEGLREVRESVGYIRGTNVSPPSVSTINAVIAGIAGDLLVRLATGFGEVPRWVGYDMLTHNTQQMSFQRRPGCRVCGDDGIEGVGTGLVSPLPAKGIEEEIFQNQGAAGLAQESQEA